MYALLVLYYTNSQTDPFHPQQVDAQQLVLPPQELQVIPVPSVYDYYCLFSLLVF